MWNQQGITTAVKGLGMAVAPLDRKLETEAKRLDPRLRDVTDERWSRGFVGYLFPPRWSQMIEHWESLLSKPALPEEGVQLIRIFTGATALAFGLGVLLDLIIRACISKRLFPEQWEQSA